MIFAYIKSRIFVIYFRTSIFGIIAKYNIFFRPPSENVQRDELIDHLELGSGRASDARGGGCGGGPRARAEEGHGHARWRPHEEEEGGSVTEGERTAARARKKRAAVFDEEEDERIDLRQALAVIYQRELLPVPATNRE